MVDKDGGLRRVLVFIRLAFSKMTIVFFQCGALKHGLVNSWYGIGLYFEDEKCILGCLVHPNPVRCKLYKMGGTGTHPGTCSFLGISRDSRSTCFGNV